MDDLLLVAKGYRRLPERDWAGRGTGKPLRAWLDPKGRVLHFEEGIKLFWLGELESRTSTGAYRIPAYSAFHE